MALDDVVSHLAGLTETMSEAALAKAQSPLIWAAFVNRFAAENKEALATVATQMDLIARSQQPALVLLGCYVQIEAIKRASRDFRALREFDEALRELAHDIVMNLPLRPRG